MFVETTYQIFIFLLSFCMVQDDQATYSKILASISPNFSSDQKQLVAVSNLDIPVGRWNARLGYPTQCRINHSVPSTLFFDGKPVNLNLMENKKYTSNLLPIPSNHFTTNLEGLCLQNELTIAPSLRRIEYAQHNEFCSLILAGKTILKNQSAKKNQAIKNVVVEPFTAPALIGSSTSPLLRIRIEVEGTENPLSLTSLTAALESSTDPEDVETLHVFLTGKNRELRAGDYPDCFIGIPGVKRLGKALYLKRFGKVVYPNGKLTFNGDAKLQPGVNYIWIACTLKTTANIDHVVGATCSQLKTSDGKAYKPVVSGKINPQRIGIALRKQGDYQRHTYRIPGLVKTNKGTLIGVYDIRMRGGSHLRSDDAPADIDVGMSRSTDGGRTWEPMRIIMDMGNDPKWKYDGISDPSVLVDRETGTIWVAAPWSHGDRSWEGSGPGFSPEETGQFMLVRSDDDGLSWSKPINITKQIKRPEWSLLMNGPGKGITMQDGTLVFPVQFQDHPEKNRLPHSTIMYSKDHGKTWNVGTGAFDDTTEAQVVEIEPGVLMINCRYNRNSTRVIMITRDLGKTWEPHPTSRKTLIEPRACMASLINIDREVGDHSSDWLLFSNPNSTSSRQSLTIKASNDKGMSWPRDQQLLLDEFKSNGYSCMAMIDDKTVGVLYESSMAHLVFQRIKLSDIIKKKQTD